MLHLLADKVGSERWKPGRSVPHRSLPKLMALWENASGLQSVISFGERMISKIYQS